jgi:hypothetical protein
VDLNVVKDVLTGHFGLFSFWVTFLISVAIAFCLYFSRSYKISVENDDKRIVELVIGFLTLSVGAYPYVVVRQRRFLELSGIEGKDTILLGIGAALVLHALIMLVIDGAVRKYVLIWLTVFGCLFFNVYYLSYQQDFYRMMGFRYQLSQHQEELEDAQNIVFYTRTLSMVSRDSEYVLNGVSELVFDDQSKLWMNGFDGLNLLSNEGAETLEFYTASTIFHMSEHDINYKKLDAVVHYTFDISLVETMKVRIYEIFDKDRYEEWLANRTTMDVYYTGTDEYLNWLDSRGLMQYAE